jgi:hypothetical protein
MLYIMIGFVLLAMMILARRFAAAWRRESARIDRLLEEFNAGVAARTEDYASSADDNGTAFVSHMTPERSQRQQRGFAA